MSSKVARIFEGDIYFIPQDMLEDFNSRVDHLKQFYDNEGNFDPYSDAYATADMNIFYGWLGANCEYSGEVA